MPFLKVQTNVEIPPDTQKTLLETLSRETASQLGKPERYVMVVLEPGQTMCFAGSDAPLAYLELKSIGLPEALTPTLSEALCRQVGETLGIAADRIYIEFSDAPRAMWGWNGGTF
ncbi:MAG TPA: hypothetical protein ENJ22_03050 [Gammaproteobacteria bacterium]|nr:hypothetical protein [Gammaproteobacteria bacterium]